MQKKSRSRESRKPRVSIVGLGYVGLSTAICLADRGFHVDGIELVPEKINAIKKGKLPFEEQGLDQMLSRAVKRKLLAVSQNYDSIQDTEITFITVGTPSREDGSIDLKYVESASKEIGKQLSRKDAYHLVVEKSTVIPGTTLGTVKETLEKSSQKKAFEDFGLCVNPEFLRESSAIYDTIHPDAIVIGSEDRRSRSKLLSLYSLFYGEKMPRVISTSLSNAELIKYSVNTFRATQLSFLNTLANICSVTSKADSREVISGLAEITKLDERYLKPGLGYGGSCLPKDLRALTSYTKKLGINSSLLEAAESVNQTQPLSALRMAQNLIGSVRGKAISLLGLAYKAGTDDVRESVALRLAHVLMEEGANLRVYDPAAMENVLQFLPSEVNFAKDSRSCLKDSDCCIIATEWQEFSKIRPAEFKKLMKIPAVVDSKRLFDPSEMESNGIKYACLGKHSDVATC